MLTPFASPPYAIRLRFEVTDSDGVHQAQLLTPATIRRQELGQSKLLSCKRLNGETDTIEIEFITNQLTVNSEHIRDGVSEAVPLSVEVILRVIDVYGNVTLQTYPIDITTILLTGTVSTLYTNQAINISEPVPPPSTIREAFELSLFYQQWVDVEGLPVVASEKVNPYALKEAAWLIWQMIGHRPEILHTFGAKKGAFCRDWTYRDNNRHSRIQRSRSRFPCIPVPRFGGRWVIGTYSGEFFRRKSASLSGRRWFI